MRAHTLNRVVAAGYLRDHRVVIVGVEPSAIAHLTSSFGVEGSVVEDDLALIASFQLLHALAVVNDREDLAVCGARLAVAFEVGFRELLVSRIGRLLDSALPGGPGALTLGLKCCLKILSIKTYAKIPRSVLDEISG